MMKKQINHTIAYLAVLLFTLSGCTRELPADGSVGGDGNGGVLQLSFTLPDQPKSSEESYDILSLSTMRIYKVESDGNGGSTESLIRKYKPATQVPPNLYLASGTYRVAVEAGDNTEATFSRRSYAGEQTFTVLAHETKVIPVVCKLTNVVVKVVFDETVKTKFDNGYHAYVTASETFSETDAENNLVPTLKYTSDATGYFLLPEEVNTLTWGFFGSSSDPDVEKNNRKTGVIELPKGGMQYTLTYKYSKSADGHLSVSVQVREYENAYDDNFIFSPQPTVSGDGFNITRTIGYYADPVKFKVASINPLASLFLTANGIRYEVMSSGVPDTSLGTEGILYTVIDEYNGALSLDGTFFAKLPAGINPLSFEMTDTDNSEGKATAKVAVAGAVGITTSDLWFGTATLSGVVTNPQTTDVKIRYCLAGSEDWTELEMTKGTDGYSYTASGTGFRANNQYQFQLIENGVESGAIITTATALGVQLPNAGFEEWHKSGSPWYPYASGGTEFWGTGNPGATSVGAEYNLTSGVEDPRPGSAGTLAAKLETKKPNVMGIGKLAAGNLFAGSFGKVSGMGGTVHMGRSFTFNARPTALRVWCKYTPVGGDKGRMFVCLINMTKDTFHVVDTNDADKTTFQPSDEFLYVDKSNPASLQGHVLGYGDQMFETVVAEWIEIIIPITYRDQYSTEKPNVLMVTAAASYRGDYFEGNVGSTMYLDDVEFIY